MSDNAEGSTPGPRRAGRALRATAAALLAAAVAFAAFSGFWLASADSGRAQAATARDEAQRAADAAVVSLQSLDYRDVEAIYDKWLTHATGLLREELETNREATIKSLQQGGTTTQASVADSAVVDLDTARGAATVIVSVIVEVTNSDGSQNDKRIRYRADMSRTDQGWLVAGLGQVAIEPVA
ncbi:hypothetical protein [Actinokineospora pegani]|uniref:hypothetical protein n=1 Tax=Actinokineospora pegani TaxID=2654637 RepID=UPI0012E9E0B8|nr:hypothetical protein [Actinokineospora pegani]